MLLLIMKRENVIMGLVFLGSIILIISGILGIIINKNSDVEAYPQIEQTRTKNLLIVSPNQPSNLPQEEEIPDKLIPEKVPYNPKDPDITINYYKAFLEKNPNHPDTPAILTAIGNLYLNKKMDYKTAASYFEQVIINYSNWEGARSVYTLLSICYDQLNDYRGKIWLYQEIMKNFPPESQEYQFAKKELGLS